MINKKNTKLQVTKLDDKFAVTIHLVDGIFRLRAFLSSTTLLSTFSPNTSLNQTLLQSYGIDQQKLLENFNPIVLLLIFTNL